MASLTRWTWVWVNSGSWWWTGRPGMLRFMGSQSWTRLSNWTEMNWTEQIQKILTGTDYCTKLFLNQPGSIFRKAEALKVWIVNAFIYYNQLLLCRSWIPMLSYATSTSLKSILKSFSSVVLKRWLENLWKFLGLFQGVHEIQILSQY